MKLTQRRSITTVTMSPVNSASPACSTVPPAKCTPQLTSVRPGRISRVSPDQNTTLPGRHTHSPVGLVHVDRHAAERLAPLDHRAVEVRVRHGDRGDPAERAHGVDGVGVHDGHAVPEDVAARRPARAAPAGRWPSTARRRRRGCPGASCRTTPRWPAAASSATVVQRCPSQPTYCRSSAQIRHTSGGLVVLDAAGAADRRVREAITSRCSSGRRRRGRRRSRPGRGRDPRRT